MTSHSESDSTPGHACNDPALEAQSMFTKLLMQVQGAKEALKALQARFNAFFQEFDFLCTPCVMVPPFDVKTR